MEIPWKKIVGFIKMFAAAAGIASFLQDKVTVFPLKRKVFDSLHSVVVNFPCKCTAGGAHMFLWNGFEEDFHKSISMNNFFYNYIFNI